jgi:hypothetical protein
VTEGQHRVDAQRAAGRQKGCQCSGDGEDGDGRQIGDEIQVTQAVELPP